ncbi:MAG TPA: anthranilate phosphoribosyltransferase [Mycobacteriales bacterium]|nr:anthranilate phosphoribosyltransferase [Mycobacteriales bacterium]
MSDRAWPALLTALLRGESLAVDDTTWAMRQVMSGEATPAQVAGFAMALRAKGETAEEVDGLVRAMLEHALPVTVEGRAVDTCGTGGDRAHTVNISTMAALVVRGAGGTVVKHGNRAASSACGSADLLEALGVVVDLPPDKVSACVQEAGIGFCFAPVFHPAFRHTAVPRRELGVPTVFNFLGPLTNPARPAAQAVGASDPRMAPVMAGVLARRGASALVFRGDDGLDELSIGAPSSVWAVAGGEVREDRVDPTALGLTPAGADTLRGGDAAHNADIARRFLAGHVGPVRDAVLLNAAAALVALAGVTEEPVVDQLRPALARAADAVDSGAAQRALDGWIEASRGGE